MIGADSILPVSTPENAGVPSEAVEKYLAALMNQKLALHSVMMIRHGSVIFEGYFAPYGRDFRHRLYSCSKSFVSCAVGLLIERGKLSLSDRAISFFPDKVPEHPHPFLAEMTIRDLLRMSTCYDSGASYTPSDPDWETTFFTAAVSHEPGAVFSYCTTATTMLCMIIKRVTGMEFLDVLRPVFDEIGISKDICCVRTPCGHEWGGSGVLATTREFGAFANLCMHYGEFKGRQLLPRDYMIEATSKQIENTVDYACPDEGMGYGYQFWVTRNNGFLFNGMGCQFALCVPDRDFVLVTTGYEELNKKGTAEIFSAFWREVYPRLEDAPLPENEKASSGLKKFGKSLKLLSPDGRAASPIADRISGKTYVFGKNRMGISEMRFSFGDAGCDMTYKTERGEHALRFRCADRVRCVFPETHYNGMTIGKPLGRGMECVTTAAWQSETELMIYIQFMEMHMAQLRLAVTFTRDGRHVTVRTAKHAEFFLQEYEGFATGQTEE